MESFAAIINGFLPIFCLDFEDRSINFDKNYKIAFKVYFSVIILFDNN